MMQRSILTVVLLTVLVPPIAGREADVEWPDRAAFDKLERAYRQTPAARIETGSGIAWGRSYALMSYVSMYRATGDLTYLKRLIEEAEAIVALRDDRRDPPLRDAVRGRIVPAWSSTRYTKGRRYAWAVHTGMITAPILEGLWLARRRLDGPDAEPSAGLLARARRDALIKMCREAVQVHAGEWRDGPGEGEGHILGLTLKKPVPLNMQNALGRSYVWLHRLTREEEYGRRVRALFTFLKNRLRQEDDCYVWAYWPPLDGPGTGFEDISHAAINVDFACLGARLGLVFKEADVARLRRTLLTRVMASDTPRDTVGGTGSTGKYAPQIALWMPLAQASEEIQKRLRGYFDAHRPGPSSTGLLTVALLLRYRPR